MIRFSITCSIVFYVIRLAKSSETESCHIITFCESNLNAKIQDAKTDSKSIFYDMIHGIDRNFKGFKPSRYDLRLSFQNSTHYVGSVNITGMTDAHIVFIMLNVNVDYVTFAHLNMSIICCGAGQQNRTCMQPMTYTTRANILEIFLSQGYIVKNSTCTISIPYFRSYARKQTRDEPVLGLLHSGRDDFSAATTTFKMRHASALFPCMDHPSFLAQFSLCIEHPKGYTAISNERIKLAEDTAINNNLELTCFQKTVPISTSMFGFALLKDYTEYSDERYEHVRLYVPSYYLHQFRWMTQSTWEIRYYMRALSNLTLPSHRMAYVVLFPGDAELVTGHGLAFFDAAASTASISRLYNKKLLYQAMMRQYIGGVFTVSRWSEICLQEGLLKYFDWYFQNEVIFNHALGDTATSDICNSIDKPLTGTDKELATDDDHCRSLGSLFFQGFAGVFGHDLLQKFLHRMIDRYFRLPATMANWDTELSALVIDIGKLNGYLKYFFGSTKPLALTFTLRADYLMVEYESNTRRKYVPVPLKILYSSSPIPKVVIVNNTLGYYFLRYNESKWVLLDPILPSCVTKTYDYRSYAAVLDPISGDSYGQITKAMQHEVAEMFCTNMLSNSVTRGDADRFQNWIPIADKVFKLNASCSCCLIRKLRLDVCSDDLREACSRAGFIHQLDVAVSPKPK